MKPYFRFHAFSVVLIITLAAGLLSIPQRSIVAATGSPDPTTPCILRVNADALAGGDGSTWDKAYNNLQYAIDAVTEAMTPCQIWVAKGTYKPTGASRLASFLLKNGVSLYGGFAGNESDLSQRDWSDNVTILSGDTGNQNDTTDNAENVVYVYSNTDNSSYLDGFTITGGNANGSHMNGGGILIDGGSPTLSDLKIQNNNASGNGGGVFINGGSPVLSVVYIQNNTAANGAGVYLTNQSNASLVFVFFSGNSATSDGGGLFHGSTCSGLFLMADSFLGNHAGLGGGGAYIQGPTGVLRANYFDHNTAESGAGLYIDSIPGSPSLFDSTFTHNTATGKGGGAYIVASSPALTDAYFADNGSAAFGGAIGNFQSSPTLTNITLSGNTAPSGAGGGIYNSKSSHPVVRNSILWGDTGGEIYNDPGYTSSTITITYSLAQGCNPGGGTWNSATCGLEGLNNVTDSDPMFKDPSHENFHLKAGSPAINRGSNTFVSGETTDLDGKPRISGGVVDLGPYEWPFYKVFVPLIKK